MKKIIYNITLVILAITFLAVVSIIVTKRTNNQIKEKELTNAVLDIKVKMKKQISSVNTTKKVEIQI